MISPAQLRHVLIAATKIVSAIFLWLLLATLEREENYILSEKVSHSTTPTCSWEKEGRQVSGIFVFELFDLRAELRHILVFVKHLGSDHLLVIY